MGEDLIFTTIVSGKMIEIVQNIIASVRLLSCMPLRCTTKVLNLLSGMSCVRVAVPTRVSLHRGPSGFSMKNEGCVFNIVLTKTKLR